MMKKLISSIALGAILISGVLFAVNAQPDDLTFGGERHPPIFMPTNSFEVEI